MSRLRLNQELRNKIASRWRVHAEAEHTNEKENIMYPSLTPSYAYCLLS